jgi:hypothetical protein
MPTRLTVASVESPPAAVGLAEESWAGALTPSRPLTPGRWRLTALLAKHSLGVVRASGGADGAPQC